MAPVDTELIILETQDSVKRVFQEVLAGRQIQVTVGFDSGPDGPEPKVELLRIVLDRLQRRFAIKQLEYVPHPYVDARYLQSCTIDLRCHPRRPAVASVNLGGPYHQLQTSQLPNRSGLPSDSPRIIRQ